MCIVVRRFRVRSLGQLTSTCMHVGSREQCAIEKGIELALSMLRARVRTTIVLHTST